MENKDYNILSEFKSKLNREPGPMGRLYSIIFDLIDDDVLLRILENEKESFKRNRESWFFFFHKSIRQHDFVEYVEILKRNKVIGNGGKFDSILWNLIHVDQDETLRTIMERLFKEFA